jgi:hypothetical protein
MPPGRSQDLDTGVTFMDCPAYTDGNGAVRCGLAAEVEDRYTLASSDGPLEAVRIRCLGGHFFNGPIAALSLDKQPDAVASDRPAPVAGLG